jgi:glycosyltransferase involved in cell wall biosynthesis
MISGSIVICTHNRAALLARVVRPALDEARTCGAEVVVVDNASTDDTARILPGLGGRDDRLQVAYEPRLGLSAARNRGLAEVRGAVAVFLDDDAVPRPGWLASHLALYSTPAVACVGGRIAVQLPGARPAWLTPPLEKALTAYDLGAPTRRYRPGDEYPCGANVSYRVAAAQALGGFSLLVGARGDRLLQHEETDLCCRIERAGGEMMYAHEAVVDHHVLPERLVPGWFLARHWEHGQSGAVFHLRNFGLRRALGRLRWHYRPHLLRVPYAPRDPVDPARLLAECRRREALGYLVGVLHGLPRWHALRRDMAAPVGGLAL